MTARATPEGVEELYRQLQTEAEAGGYNLNPDEEFTRWLEERGRILKMNQEFKAQSTRGGARERAVAAEMEVPD